MPAGNFFGGQFFGGGFFGVSAQVARGIATHTPGSKRTTNYESRRIREDQVALAKTIASEELRRLIRGHDGLLDLPEAALELPSKLNKRRSEEDILLLLLMVGASL